MRTKFGRRLIAMVGMACLGVSLLFTPAATKTVSAAMPGVSEPNQNYIEWVYMADPGTKCLYKRLLNKTTGDWVGDWIYVRRLEDWELDAWFNS